MAINSQGSTFSVLSDGSPGTWLLVNEASSIRDLMSGSGAEIDVTNLSSTAKEYLIGLKDEGTMSLDVFFNATDPGQVRMRQLRSNRGIGQFQVFVPPGEDEDDESITFTFEGRVTTTPFSLAVDAAATGTISVRVTGEITESFGSPS